MRIERWSREVFLGAGTFRAVYFWAVTVPLAIIVLSPRVASHLPTYLQYTPACGLLVGFVVCNIAAFDRVNARAEAAECRLKGLSIDLKSATAGEHVYPRDVASGRIKAHHSVVIELVLTVRNHDGGNASSIELVKCATDLQSGSCDDFVFQRDIYNNVVEDDPTCRTIPSGAIRSLVVTVLHQLPISATHISAMRVNGELQLRDNRKTPLIVPFSSELAKNPIQHGDRSYKAIRRENGQPDVVTHFPDTASPADAIRWCEADGYKVIGSQIIDTPEDEHFISTTMINVESKTPLVEEGSGKG